MTAHGLIRRAEPHRTTRWRGTGIIIDQEPRLGTGAPAPARSRANKGTTT